jgi:hypothetical protein
MKHSLLILGGLFVLTAGLCAADEVDSALLPAARYREVGRLSVGGQSQPGQLAVGAAERRLYVTRGSELEIFDVDTNTRAGTVAPLQAAKGVAIASESHHGFVSCGGDDTVVMFDLGTGKIERTIKSTGQGVDAVVFDPYTKRVFIANDASGNILVLDSGTGEVVSTIQVGGPLGAMSTNEYGRLFVLAPDAVHVVDTRSMELLGDFPAGPGPKLAGSVGLFADGVWGEALVESDQGKMTAIDARLGNRLFGDIAVGGSGAAGVTAEREAVVAPAFHHGRSYVASADGTLTVMDVMGMSYRFFQKLPTEPGAHAVALDSKTHRVFVSGPSTVFIIGR